MLFNLILTCPFCCAEHEVNVPFEGYLAWESGELIQDALPMLSATEREQLISNLCPTCQREIFGEED